MKNETYFIILLIACLIGAAAVVGINRKIDIFGLYGDHPCGNISIYGEEQYTKYLHMHRYVPECYNGLLLGASLSANLDPVDIQGYRVYNASLMGARIGQLDQLYSAAVDQGAQFDVVIIGIHPYLTGVSEGPNMHLAEKGLQSAWGSLSLLRVYGFALIRKFGLWESKFPRNQYDANGRNDYNRFFQVPDVDAHILEKAKNTEIQALANNKEGMKSLAGLLEKICQSRSNLLLYFHPIPDEIYRANQETLASYWQQIEHLANLYDNQVIAADFNTHPAKVNKNYKNYIDHGHLSEQGQQKLIELINERLREFR
ncbi:hypothetical protein [Lunatimonas salinarum]|uniref:hypothetical protein n=1 Tax=Lunatimonas salinarum TaxID=1774590 RepID=UPI001AE00DE4|nr:hypothetical protein [Lunatimonas salinarum]